MIHLHTDSGDNRISFWRVHPRYTKTHEQIEGISVPCRVRVCRQLSDQRFKEWKAWCDLYSTDEIDMSNLGFTATNYIFTKKG